MGFFGGVGYINFSKKHTQLSQHPILIHVVYLSDFMLVFILEVYCFVDLQLLVVFLFRILS